MPAQVRDLLPRVVEGDGRKARRAPSARHARHGAGDSLPVSMRRVDLRLVGGGLGGCPFAPGATGNVATEDVLYLLDRIGIETGIDLDALIAVARWLAGELGHDLPGRVLTRRALPAGRRGLAAQAGRRALAVNGLAAGEGEVHGVVVDRPPAPAYRAARAVPGSRRSLANPSNTSLLGQASTMQDAVVGAAGRRAGSCWQAPISATIAS